MQFYQNRVTYTTHDVLSEADINRNNVKPQQMCYFAIKRTSLVNKAQNMLHKLRLDETACPYLTGKYINRWIQIYLNFASKYW